MNNKLGFAGIAVAVLALLVALLGGKPNVVTNTVERIVGASPGPDRYADSFSDNDVRKYSLSGTIAGRNGTTTICSFRTPPATTTLRHASVKLTTGTTTSTQFEWGQSTVMDATTTSLGRVVVADTVGGATILASTTGSVVDTLLDDTIVFAPNEYLNLKYGNSSCTEGGTCNAFVGNCQAEFTQN